MEDPRRALVSAARAGLARVAARSGTARRVMARTGSELVRAAGGPAAWGSQDFYGGGYFGEGRDPGGDRQGLSGYASYDRLSSNADIAAFLLWRNFRASRALDVGCATGFLVEALRELGVDAEGCDASDYAVSHAAPGARGHIRRGDLAGGLPYRDGEFELVSALEVLEHLAPEAVPGALAELRRVCAGVLYATIPSYGTNLSGPDGHLEGKVRPERLDHYRGPGTDLEGGPVPFDDLAVDARGEPVEGHLTIASFAWWTRQFAQAGLIRRPEVEERLYADIAPAGLAPYWNLYVMSVPDAPESLWEPRSPELSLADLGLSHPLLAAGEGPPAP